MNNDLMKDKGLWWTLALGGALTFPHLAALAGAGFVGYHGLRLLGRGTAKAAGAIGKTIAASKEAARRRQADEVYRRGAPERARLQREAEARALALRVAQHRRESMRTHLELLYLHYPAIRRQLSPERFTQFLQMRMGDTLPPEVVEERGRQFQRLLRQLGERPAPAAGTEAYLNWCREQMIRTAALPLDPQIKREAMTGLQQSLLATEQLLVARQAQQHDHTRMDVQIADLHRRHEANLAAIRILQGAVDDALLQDLLSAERLRFRNQLLELAEGPRHV